MTTVLSATYANAGHTAAIAVTDDHGPIALSAEDTPALWTLMLSTLTPDDYVAETQSEFDTGAINAALASEGSVFRALAELIFEQINTLRSEAGLSTFTKAQFKSALLDKMRD